MAEASITVVIPAWDRYVGYLPEAIDSVARDSPDAAIVVVDNASEVPVTAPPEVSVVRASRRLTVGAARNLGLHHVATRYVAVLDADDKLLPNTLEFLRSRLDADSTVSVATTAILDSESGERHRFPRKSLSRLSRWPRAFAFLEAVWSLFPIQSCALLRTDQVREAGGYPDADWGDDWVLAVSLTFRGRVELHDRPGRYYRDTPDSLWRGGRRPGENVASAKRVRRRLRTDPAIPTWGRALLPLISLLQFTNLFLVRPVYVVLRRVRGGSTYRPSA
jgi:glycosyltransferase involved in cell wall biosynthesis